MKIATVLEKSLANRFKPFTPFTLSVTTNQTFFTFLPSGVTPFCLYRTAIISATA